VKKVSGYRFQASGKIPDAFKSPRVQYFCKPLSEGWRIATFDVEWHTRENATDFGDPARSGKSAQEHVLVTVELQRDLDRASRGLAALHTALWGKTDPRCG
jgi:hypothetical protein